MARHYDVTINGGTIPARPGDVLLDAALLAGREIPHDCRSGQCGTCLVRLVDGRVLGGESRQRGMIHACQARVFSDLDISVEDVPRAASANGHLTRIDEVGADVVELTVRSREPFRHLPGQYYRFRFNGYPSRCFSPTAPLTGTAAPGTIRLNVKRVRDGRVTQALGADIGEGHKVRIDGPFGHAFLRPGQSGRLVLVGSGTGFAPVWAIAAAALAEQPDREVVLIGGARRLSQLYMAPALAGMVGLANVSIALATEEPQEASSYVGLGSAADQMPPLVASDIVYAAGAPRVVDQAATAAEAAGATFYADPFEANPPVADGMIDRMWSMLGGVLWRPALSGGGPQPIVRPQPVKHDEVSKRERVGGTQASGSARWRPQMARGPSLGEPLNRGAGELPRRRRG